MCTPNATAQQERDAQNANNIDEKANSKCIYLLQLQGKRPHFITAYKMQGDRSTVRCIAHEEKCNTSPNVKLIKPPEHLE